MHDQHGAGLGQLQQPAGVAEQPVELRVIDHGDADGLAFLAKLRVALGKARPCGETFGGLILAQVAHQHVEIGAQHRQHHRGADIADTDKAYGSLAHLVLPFEVFEFQGQSDWRSQRDCTSSTQFPTFHLPQLPMPARGSSPL